MDKTEEFNETKHNAATQDLTAALADKAEYLKKLSQAITAQDDRLIYQLIDGKRYASEVLQTRTGARFDGHEALVTDLHATLSTYLSARLVAYLQAVFPFFYFESTADGTIQFYFGNWWGRRLFGTLDVLNVKFNFDTTEYNKLAKSFKLESSHKRLNTDKISQLSQQSDELQKLIDSQDQRDAAKTKIRRQLKKNAQERVMLWEASKQKDIKTRLTEELSRLTALDEQANAAFEQVRQNKAQILTLSKEDTLLSYEKQSVIAKFGTFDNFNAAVDNLYRNYLAELIAQKGQVSAND